eukprot:gb/GECG01005083.1/.p1 GENE.gb/GECG01005083.1/~~gb/GECG01005083.1/.p1  ORF type:complete len:322 (+),score=50.18 gb/GECG01005083.1/:1-966(+)
MNGNAQNGNSQPEWAVDIRDLTFKYPGASEPTLKNITLQLKPGSRCLLVGGNGAGKTSILKLLSGKHIHHGHVEVLGRDVFHDTSLNLKRAYMGTDWGKRTVAFAGYGCALTADIRVGDMMKEEQNEFPERRQFLLDLLGVDEDWRMHQLSDGQRRRVQIFLQLLRPSEILLLDEITTDLDVLARQDFLEYLKEDSERNGTTLVYATHIFDGLDDWGTHLAWLSEGKIAEFSTFSECKKLNELREKGVRAPLLRTVESWLREEHDKFVREGKSLKESAALAGEDFLDMNAKAQEGKTFAPNGFAPGRFYGYTPSETQAKSS